MLSLKHGSEDWHQTRHFCRIPVTGAADRGSDLTIFGIRGQRLSERDATTERAAAATAAGPGLTRPGEAGPLVDGAGARGEDRAEGMVMWAQ